MLDEVDVDEDEEEEEDMGSSSSSRSGPLVITDSGRKRRRKQSSGKSLCCCKLSSGFQPFCLRTRLSIISDPAVPVLAKILWSCVLISVIALSAYLIYELSRDFLGAGLRTELETVRSREVEFPEIHLHHVNQIRYSLSETYLN